VPSSEGLRPEEDPTRPGGTSGDAPTALDGPPSTSAPRGAPAGQPTFAPDDIAAGRYRIRRLIAVGGIGEVYEADDLDLHQKVAIKTLRPEVVGDARAIDLLRREVRLSRAVTHPNVCRVFDLVEEPAGDADESRGRMFLTMELVVGESLAERLRRVGRMTPAEALPVAEQLAAGLDAAHAVGIVHRDLKCGNVLLAESDVGTRAVVTDFGLARGLASDMGTLHSIAAGGDLVGTPAFMSPEQIEGGSVTAAADVYALGIVLYAMVTGTRPFVADTPLAEALQRLKIPPPPPRTHAAELDPAWDAAILRCLEREPADRFASAGDAIRALRGEPVAGPRRIARRRRRVVAAALVVTLILAAAVAVALHRSSPVDALRERALAQLRVGDAVAARDLLERVVIAEPGDALARSMLAQSLWEMGSQEAAKREARKALASAHDLSADAQLLVEGRSLEYGGDSKGAVDRYRKLWMLHPDDFEHGLRFARAEVYVHKNSIPILQALRRLPLPASGDTRIDLVEGWSWGSPDFQRWLACAQRAERKARARDEPMLLAEALVQEGWAFEAADRLADASAAFGEALEVLGAHGQLDQGGAAHNGLAATMQRLGRLTVARNNYDSAIEAFRALGDRKGLQSSEWHVAGLLLEQGRIAEAKRLLEDAVAIRLDLFGPDVAEQRGVLAWIRALEGDLPGAKEVLLPIAADTGSRLCHAEIPLGRTLLFQGDLDGARRELELVLRTGCGAPLPASRRAEALAVLADVLRARGDLDGAISAQGDASDICACLREALEATKGRVTLAQLLLDGGRPAEAEALARDAADRLAEQGCDDDEARSRAILALAQVAHGERPEASNVDRVAVLVARSESVPARLGGRIALARIRAATGEPHAVTASLQDLEAVLAEATSAGFVNLAFDARLAAGEIESLRSASEGRKHLDALARDAGAAGFRLVARQASAARR
jgi:tetratricopeptide (TPR) repeat protein